MARNLDGLEMMCFCQSKQFEMTYSGGGVYVDLVDKPINDLMDMNCYICTASYYTREGDPIAFCPNCGHFDRKRFSTKEDLVEALRGQSWRWLERNGQKVMMVQTWDGDWQLRFAPSELQLQQTGRYQKVVAY